MNSAFCSTFLITLTTKRSKSNTKRPRDVETCWGKRGKQLKVPFPNTQDGLGQDATWGVHAEGELSGVFFFFFSFIYLCYQISNRPCKELAG